MIIFSRTIGHGVIILCLYFLSTLRVCAELNIDNPDYISQNSTFTDQNDIVKVTDNEQVSLRNQLIDVNNLIEVKVKQDSKINKTVRVDSLGFITLDLIGKIKISGRTVNDLEKDIASKLEIDFIKNPIVNVKLLEYKASTILVSGAIGRSGKYKLFPGMTLLDAISIAGNFTAKSDYSNIGVKRTNTKNTGNEEIKFDLDLILTGKIADFPLESGDQIVVHELTPIILEGAFLSPGPVYTKVNIPLREVLSKGGGLVKMADVNRIMIFDTISRDINTVKLLDLEAVLQGKIKEPLVSPGSVILVEECLAKSKVFGKITCTRK